MKAFTVLFLLGFLSSCNSLEVVDPEIPSGSVTQQISCPTGFVLVPKNTAVGTTSDFCVMQLEARDDSGSVGFDATDLPWSNIDQTTAKTKCAALGTGYGLISNPEWMTIARNIEAQSVNWSSGTVGTGCIFMGNSGQFSACGYDNGWTADSGDLTLRNPKAKLTLSNGSVIWDMPGNLIEWIDWNVVNDKAFASSDGSSGPWDREFSTIDTMIALTDVMKPSTWQSINHPNYNTSHGIGDYTAGWSGTGGAAQRGGHYQHWGRAGIYQLDINNPPENSNSYIGFRCVWRP